ncbi:ABC transporter permease [Schumannella soli]|uniref:ABC transporter permease n=1 Tax=Schumannella soli TaxID=2590779 RepID=A0A506XX89_9MICO|nr:ABC transporter permease [Schumannella soli]TPW74243.1 ABC transporter permease [Schumannella soli]
MVSTDAARSRPGRAAHIERLRRFGLWIVLVVVVVVLAVASPTFRDVDNLLNVLQQNSIIGIVACGMAIMMISGGFDLSVGAIGASSSVLGAVVAQAGGGDAAIPAGIGIGLLIGAINGFFVARVRINAFVTTFAMASVVAGLLFVATTAQSTVASSPAIDLLGAGAVGPIPIVFLVFVAALLVVWLLLSRTKFGHYVYSVGGNAEASRLSGVPVQAVQLLAFVLGGGFAGLGGILLLGQTQVGQPSAAATWPLNAIAICVVGGVALTGGVGRIADVFAATLLLGVIANGLNQLDVSSYWQPAVTGVVILGAVILDQINRRRRSAAVRAVDTSTPTLAAAVATEESGVHPTLR